MSTLRGFLAAGVCMTCAMLARAEEPKRRVSHAEKAPAAIAEMVAELLPDRPRVFVAEFRSVASLHTGLSQRVAEELEKKGFEIKSGSATEIEGRLFDPDDGGAFSTGFRIKGKVVHPDGQESGFEVEVVNADEGRALGESAETAAPPDASLKGTDLRPVIEPVCVNGRLKPSPRSPYALEVVVEKGRTPKGDPMYEQRPIEAHHEFFVVRLKKGEVFAVHLWNESQYEAAVDLEMDGLNTFAFHDDPKYRQSFRLLRPHAFAFAQGFHTDDTAFRPFRAEELDEAIAARLYNPKVPDIQTICAMFRTAWRSDHRPPPHEPPIRKPPTVRPGRNFLPEMPSTWTIGGLRAVLKVRVIPPD